MEIVLKPSCLDELSTLNMLYDAACRFFKSIDPDPRGTPPEICITKGCLPPNGVFENYRIMSIYFEKKLIGYCDYYLGYPDNKTVYLSFIYIDELYRKKGIAAQAIRVLLNQFTADGYKLARLTVSLKNWNGMKFWIKNGFQRITFAAIETEFGVDKYGALELEKNIS